MLQLIGHGVIYNDEPCLCFECEEEDRIDYVPAERLRKLFMETRDAPPTLPALGDFLERLRIISRGRHSAGIASGLHDLGMCVIGYNAKSMTMTNRCWPRKLYKSLASINPCRIPSRTPTW